MGLNQRFDQLIFVSQNLFGCIPEQRTRVHPSKGNPGNTVDGFAFNCLDNSFFSCQHYDLLVLLGRLDQVPGVGGGSRRVRRVFIRSDA